MRALKIALVTIPVAAIALVIACGSKSKSSSTSNATASPTAASGNGVASCLPSAYTSGSGVCASCHGSDGTGGAVTNNVSLRGGNGLTEAKFLDYVRNGYPGTAMAAHTTSDISDADVQQLYNCMVSNP